MAREKIAMIPKEPVKWMKPAHNPTGELIRAIMEECSKNKKK